jgi:L-amino acid N-acyltransferase YncA
MSQQGNMSIRKFNSSDLPAIKAFVNHTIDVCYTRVYPQEAVRFFKDWHSNEKILSDSREGYIIVLEQKGRVIGTGTLVGDEIKRVFVEPSFQKQGFGRAIMRKLEEKAGSLGVAEVKLDASLPSKRFYDLLRYTTLEETFLEVENNKRLHYYKMVKRLTNENTTNIMDIIVEKMRRENWSDVRNIYQEGIDTGNATFETEVPEWKEWDKSHLRNCRLAAKVQGQVVGWVVLSPVSGRCCYSGVAEVSLYVKVSARGRGIGKALLQEVIRQSEAAGIWTLQGCSFRENAASLALQKACGFREVGYRERVSRLNGVWKDVILTERRSKVAGV